MLASKNILVLLFTLVVVTMVLLAIDTNYSVINNVNTPTSFKLHNSSTNSNLISTPFHDIPALVTQGNNNNDYDNDNNINNYNNDNNIDITNPTNKHEDTIFDFPTAETAEPIVEEEQNIITQPKEEEEVNPTIPPTIPPIISPLNNLNEISQMLQLPLALECTSTKWNPNLYLHCDPIVMGAYNAINKLQVCIRWAIDTGAGLVRPQFTTRGEQLTDIRGDFPRVSIEYLLDERFLWEALTVNCPQLKVVELDAVKDNATFLNGIEVEYFIERYWKGELGPKIHAIVNNSGVIASAEHPIVVREKETLAAWIRSYDTFEFQIAFRNIFRLSRVYVPFSEKILRRLPPFFFGVHLRLEKDWTANKDDVMDVFITKILEHNTTSNPIAFVASGDEDKLAQFTTFAAKRGVVVVHKWNLLDEEDIQFIQQLDFDQMGMVDRLVLEKAEYFYGVGGSSYSYSLGQHRHYAEFKDMEFYPRNDERQYLEGWEGDMWYGLLW